MSTTLDFIEYVCEQLEGSGVIRYRKMFGEYCVYINDKPVFLVCDNMVYVKKLKELEQIISPDSVGFPYPGAKEHYIIDIDDAGSALEAALTAEREIPLPKPKTKKKKEV